MYECRETPVELYKRVPEGISFVTVLLAPITTLLPIVMGPATTEPVLIWQLFPITGVWIDSPLLPCRSLQLLPPSVTYCPIITFSPMLLAAMMIPYGCGSLKYGPISRHPSSMW